MNKLNRKLWVFTAVIFLAIIGFWIFTRRPSWFTQAGSRPRYINFESAAQSVRQCLVRINNLGYGTIIHRRGYVLAVNPGQYQPDLNKTANNLPVIDTEIPQKNLYLTTYTGESFPGEIVKIDRQNGLALLKIMVNREFPPLPAASSGNRLKPGELLFSVTEKGIVISKVLKINQTEKKLFQVEMIPGSLIAGLPLFQENSELVGICTNFTVPGDNDSSVYAVPVSRAKGLLTTMSRIVPRIIQTSRKTTRIDWLGASFLPETDISGMNLLVEKVNQPQNSMTVWQYSGFKTGDKIIKINNGPLTGLIDLERTLPSLAQYRKVDFTIIRDNREKRIAIRIPRRSLFLQNISYLPPILVFLFFLLIYYLVYQNWIDRTALFVLGAVLITVIGYHLNFYDVSGAWGSLKNNIDVLYFIIGMNILTVILAEGGLFNFLAGKISLMTRGNRWSIMFSFCLLTYLFSLFVNNLTTIMVIVPMILSLSRYLSFDPKPYIIGMIVASNLGGASTMVGDFPNMLIGTETGIAFNKFIWYMLPVCFVELVVFLIYIRISQRNLFTEKRKNEEIFEDLPQLEEDKFGISKKEDIFLKIGQRLKQGLKNPPAVRRGLLILGILIAIFLISDLIHLPPAVIALAGGLAGLFFGKIDIKIILEKMNYKDIFFFAGLFILVGAAEASGLLNWLGEAIFHLSFGSVLARCLILMWLAGLVTAFCNAGPSTALFLPLVMNFRTSSPHQLYFWSLSLGVLAGSSATLTGATAGSVSSTMFNEYLERQRLPISNKLNRLSNFFRPRRESLFPLSFREYAKIGVPVGLIFLIISSVYVTLIYVW